jgi:hypothetical protein
MSSHKKGYNDLVMKVGPRSNQFDASRHEQSRMMFAEETQRNPGDGSFEAILLIAQNRSSNTGELICPSKTWIKIKNPKAPAATRAVDELSNRPKTKERPGGT